MLHKWMPRDYSPPSTLKQPAQLQRNTSGIFAGRILLVDDCEARHATDHAQARTGVRTLALSHLLATPRVPRR